MDLDQFAERAAIMEYDGGLSRFDAETAAAKAQGKPRHEFINAIRDFEQARHQRQADARDATDHLPAMQSNAAQKARSLPVGDVR